MKNQTLNTISLISIDQIQDWENVFRVVGIGCCEPLLIDAGLPKDIANNPKGLIEAAHFFWQKRWAGVTLEGRQVGYGYSDPGFPENYRLGLQLLLNNTFKIVFDNYDEPSVLRLNSWTQRHFIDKSQVNCLYIWSHLLHAIINRQGEDYREGQPFSLPFHDDTAKSITTLIDKNLGVEVRRLWDQKIEQARKIQLSSYEKRTVKLEAVRPTDIAEFDVLGTVRMVMENQHIYQFWQEVNQWMTQGEMERLLWWGYEQAKAIGLPIEDVVLPDIEKLEEDL